MPDLEFPPAKKRKLGDWAKEDGAFSCFDTRVSTTKAAQLMLIRECASFLGETIKLDGLPSANKRSLQSVYDQVQTQLTQVLRPFTIVVLGSFNTGKSTLINAMFAEDLCKTGVVVTTDQIQILAHSPTEHDIEDSTVKYKFCPQFNKLLELNIVDTPGLNALPKFQHSEITSKFLPNADLVLLVTSVDKLINRSDAEFLKTISNWKAPILFILNKIDHCNDDEINTCVEFIKKHADDYFKKVLVMPVAAKMYYVAKQNGDDAKIRKSRFEHLLQFIDHLHRGRMWFLKAMGPIEKCMSSTQVVHQSLDTLIDLVENDRKGIDELNKAIETLLDVEIATVEVKNGQRESDLFFDNNFTYSTQSVVLVTTCPNLARLHFDQVLEPVKTRLLAEATKFSDDLVNKLNGRMRQLLKKVPHEFSCLTKSTFHQKSIDLHLAKVHEFRDKIQKSIEDLFDTFLDESPANELNKIFSGSLIASGGFAGSALSMIGGLAIPTALMFGGYFAFKWRFNTVKSNCKMQIGKLGRDVQNLYGQHADHVRQIIRNSLQLMIDPIRTQLSEIEQASVVQKSKLQDLKAKLESMKEDLKDLMNSSDKPIPSLEELVHEAKRRSLMC